ncbi:hypothetical protein [Aliiroseovarius sp. YM-037]|uniref:hypothetical protein n=1 Tax=Aliiroseovarius sp. YM-037 TaxID=3341728 RepID=UPI003A80101C
MPLMRVNIETDTAVPVGPDPRLGTVLREHLANAPHGPIVILIHGMTFSPSSSHHCPHHHILSLDPALKAKHVVSWPRHLGFGRDKSDEGLCIAVGWEARRGFRAAYRAAADAGLGVAKLVAAIHDLAPDRKVNVVAHSLGARVFLSALRYSPNTYGRAILMAAAELGEVATTLIDCPAGRSAEVINVTSRENDIFDLLVERGVRPLGFRSRALGAGLNEGNARWLNLQIDCERTRDGLDQLGFRIARPVRRVCHRSGYLRPGMFPLYAALLRTPETLPLNLLRTAIPPVPAPRWSRLFQRPTAVPPLPFLRKA